eukprot:1145340-Pelagomonas_calceolata.AAC.1
MSIALGRELSEKTVLGVPLYMPLKAVAAHPAMTYNASSTTAVAAADLDQGLQGNHVAWPTTSSACGVTLQQHDVSQWQPQLAAQPQQQQFTLEQDAHRLHNLSSFSYSNSISNCSKRSNSIMLLARNYLFMALTRAFK